MKKAAKIVAIVSLVLDYMILIGLIAFALYLFLNIDVIVNNNVSNAMAASSSSSAMASSSMSSDGTEAVGKAIGGAVVAFGSAIAVMMVMVFSFLGAAFMIFPIITMHVAIKKLAKATCRQDMLAISIVAIFALQPVAAIMFLAMPDEAYAAQ